MKKLGELSTIGVCCFTEIRRGPAEIHREIGLGFKWRTNILHGERSNHIGIRMDLAVSLQLDFPRTLDSDGGNHTFAPERQMMKILLGPFYLLFKLYMLLVFFLVWAVFYPFVHYLLKDPATHPRAFKVKVLWCRVLAALMFTRFKIHGKENMDFDGSCVVCINHQSYMDIIYMYPVIDRYFKFIGKKELRKWLMIGVFFRKGMDISISRENAKEARVSLDEAMDALSKGVSVAIFPEGEIPLDTPQLKRFKNGGFKMALSTQRPILPVTFLRNHNRLHEPNNPFGKSTPGLCEVIIHPLIHTQGMDLMDIAPLRDKVYEVINAPLVERGLSRSPSPKNT